MIQRVHYSSTSSLTMEFHTDHLQSGNRGFRGIFKYISKGKFSYTSVFVSLIKIIEISICGAGCGY